jgi:hypothetical protein
VTGGACIKGGAIPLSDVPATRHRLATPAALNKGQLEFQRLVEVSDRVVGAQAAAHPGLTIVQRALRIRTRVAGAGRPAG